MGFMSKWARACDGKGPDPHRNMPDELMIAKAALRHSPRIKKNDHVGELARSVAQKTGVQLTDEEATRLVQEVYIELGMGAIPWWSTFECTEE